MIAATHPPNRAAASFEDSDSPFERDVILMSRMDSDGVWLRLDGLGRRLTLSGEAGSGFGLQLSIAAALQLRSGPEPNTTCDTRAAIHDALPQSG